VRQLDQLRIGLGPFGAFYVGHFFLYGGSVLPNDRLHKTNYTLAYVNIKKWKRFLRRHKSTSHRHSLSTIGQ
ncbi:hypothetical protein, partial [Collimonas sp.]|uniref:hypothetical protein n=1 Tax=Collimonas sp. TaxID=1963772 RepID=UPI0037BF9B96